MAAIEEIQVERQSNPEVRESSIVAKRSNRTRGSRIGNNGTHAANKVTIKAKLHQGRGLRPPKTTLT